MATGSDETAARIEREQSFHDVRFAEDADERSADKFYALVGPSQSRYERLLAEFPTGSRALELGCGLEINAWELLESGVDATAIDISQIAIDQAADKAESLGEDRDRFVHMNAEQLGRLSELAEDFRDRFEVNQGTGDTRHRYCGHDRVCFRAVGVIAPRSRDRRQRSVATPVENVFCNRNHRSGIHAATEH